MRRAHQARSSIHRGTEVITVAELGDTGVDAHSDPQGLTHYPRLVTQRQLTCDRRIDGRTCRRERRMDAVTRPLDQSATIRVDSFTQDEVMSPKRATHRVRFPLPQTRRNFEVAEQKCHGPGRELNHDGRCRAA
jgi:hypothetical protein